MISELIHTLLPEPVAPAMSTCGIFDRSPMIDSPDISFPRATDILLVLLWNFESSITSLRYTGVVSLFGISMPTAAFPGIGASILTPLAARASAMSSDRLTILETFTPAFGCSS